MLPRLTNGNRGCIEAPALFFSKLGNLHDAKIKLLEWSPIQREVALLLDDLYSNFVGLPEYEEAQPVRLVLGCITKLEIEVITDQLPMRIIDFEIEEAIDSKLRVNVNLAPTGFIRVVCDWIVGSMP